MNCSRIVKNGWSANRISAKTQQCVNRLDFSTAVASCTSTRFRLKSFHKPQFGSHYSPIQIRFFNSSNHLSSDPNPSSSSHSHSHSHSDRNQNGKDSVSSIPSSPRPSAHSSLGLTLWQRTKTWSRPYLALSRIDKPIGTWLLFWPCAWSITLASHALEAPPSVMFGNILLFGVGAIVMRGAGCTINDMWDVKVDKMVERTKSRPLAAGELTYFQALSFLGVQLSVGLGVLVNLNWYSILLGASSLSIVTIYPLMKRITYWPQLVLGLAFNWGALLGWSAIAGNCQWLTVLPLYFGSVCWTLVYDTIYAHQDKKDDITAGVKSTALLFSNSTIPILSTFSTLFISSLVYSVSTVSPLLPTTVSSGSASQLLGPLITTGHPFFLLSTASSSLHLFRQLSRTDLNSRQSCWNCFVSNRDLGAIVWFGLVSDYLIQVGLKSFLNGLVVVA